MKWVGCFQRKSNKETEEDVIDDPQNTMPRPFGYTSVACARACRSYRYFMLGDGGYCYCLAVHPKSPGFKEVDSEQCGKVCETEEALFPKRFCGTASAVAVYRVESAAEVREEIESATGKDVPFGKDIWSSIAETSGNAFPPKDGKLDRPARSVMKGVSYGPVPLRTRGGLPDDDFMSGMTEALWSPTGRGDLAVIKSLGANTVRLYGNDPALDHTEFLDEALAQGLQVVAGISDYPYTQMPENCASTQFNCYTQVKSQYLQNLKRGFLAVGNAYHPALRTMILMNEPDLKFGGGPPSYCKAIVSAFDAVLDAEREVGIAGQAPTLTTTFSFGVCGHACTENGDKPAIGQMLALRHAMQDPESVGYKPNNDLWAAYQLRFINSVNTANPATDMPWLFLDTYNTLFPKVPVFIGEYHSPRTLDQQRDLETILAIASDEKSMLMGISFFEFQVRYDKGGSEMSFGMFGLEARTVGDMQIGNGAFSAYCLKPLEVAQIENDIYKMDCGSVEAGLEYETDSSWTLVPDNIAEACKCCQQCRYHQECLSWSWFEDANSTIPGNQAKCVLKGGLPIGKVPRDGVISGIPYGIEGRVASVRRLRGSADEDDHDKVQFRFGQCGGQFWEGPKQCPHDFKCNRLSEFYSQCVPKDAHEAKKAGHKINNVVPNIYVHMAVAAAFGGEGVTAQQMCPLETTTTSSTPARKKRHDHDADEGTEENKGGHAAAGQSAVGQGAGGRGASGGDAGDAAHKSGGKSDDAAGGKGGDNGGEVSLEGAEDVEEPMVEWHGCYIHAAGSEYIYANERGGYSSTACSIACTGYSYALLHNNGHCSCSNTEPELSMFSLVDPSLCGKVCEKEDGLNPTRFCGTEAGFAIYKLLPATTKA